MREYVYFIDGSHTLVRDGSYGVEELYREEPVWKKADEYYWREIYFGQGFDCLWLISLEEAREYLVRWGLDPELAQAFPTPRGSQIT